MADSAYVMEAHGLCKTYGSVVALQGLDLAVSRGEVCCLLGANGAGKTTTINLFLGFHKPDQGTARIDGIDVASNKDAARRRVAYLPESVSLYGKLTGLENMTFFARVAGQRHDASELSAILSKAGLPEEAHDRRVATYSKGMRQKVGIAIALAKGVPAILLDEPLSGLDPSASRDLGERILDLRDSGCGLLMATHDIFRAREVADRIGIMMRGRLVQVLDAKALDAREIEDIYMKHLHEVSANQGQERMT